MNKLCTSSHFGITELNSLLYYISNYNLILCYSNKGTGKLNFKDKVSVMGADTKNNKMANRKCQDSGM